MVLADCDHQAFNRHLFHGGNRPDIHRIINIRRNGIIRPFAARYVLATKDITVPMAPMIDWFVPMVHLAPRSAYNIVYDGRQIHRGATMAGAFAIRDRRVGQYNDSRTVDNVSFYIPAAEMDIITYQSKSPKIDELPALLDRHCHDEIMFQIAKMMDFVLEHPSEVSALFIGHVFEVICLHIAKTYGGLLDRQSYPRGGLSPRQEGKVKTLLLEDLRADISLEELAACCDMSERHFTRAFKQSTGLPPYRWLVSKRLERVRWMLQTSSAPISEIALDCGFASQSHLTRAFSRSIGVSPAAWRRSRRT